MAGAGVAVGKDVEPAQIQRKPTKRTILTNGHNAQGPQTTHTGLAGQAGPATQGASGHGLTNGGVTAVDNAQVPRAMRNVAAPDQIGTGDPGNAAVQVLQEQQAPGPIQPGKPPRTPPEMLGVGAGHLGAANQGNNPALFFGEPLLIPGTSPAVLAYPHSSPMIQDAFRLRFPQVIHMFRQNIARHPELGPNMSWIDFTLRLCGQSGQAPHPSILVFCRPREFNNLQTLLMSKELAIQYLLRRQRKIDFLKILGGSTPDTNARPDRPLFNIYFWRGAAPRTLLGETEELEVIVKPRLADLSRGALPGSWEALMVPTKTLHGGIVTVASDRSKSSTIGAIIQIDGQLYGVTTRHGLVSPPETDTYPQETNYSSSPASRSRRSSSSAFEWSFMVDDIKYEDISELEYEQMADRSNASNRSSISAVSEPATDDGVIEYTTAVIPSYDLLGDLDADWALIKLQYTLLGDRFGGNQPGLQPVRDYRRDSPKEEVMVFIIKKDFSFRHAFLKPGVSVLGGINGGKASEVWSADMPGMDLEKGDSGSLVIGSDDYLIYGIVVGTNPLGEIYISPFFSIMEQVQRCFPRATVSLPKSTVYAQTAYKDERPLPEASIVLSPAAQQMVSSPYPPGYDLGRREPEFRPLRGIVVHALPEAPPLPPIREDSTTRIDGTAFPPTSTSPALINHIGDVYTLADAARARRAMMGIPPDNSHYYGDYVGGTASTSSASGRIQHFLRGSHGGGGSIASSGHTVSTAPTSYTSYGSRGPGIPSWQRAWQSSQTEDDSKKSLDRDRRMER